MSKGVNALRNPARSMLIITHYQRMLEYITPDVVAEKDGRRMLFEVETSGSLDAPSTRVELQTFAIHAAENDMLYYLVVPENIRKRAEMALEMIEERKQRATFVLSMPS